MTFRLPLGLFAVFLLSLAPEAVAQDAPSSPNRWGYVCSQEPWGGDPNGFTLVAASSDDGCAWRDRNDQVVEADLAEISDLLQDLNDATHWLSRNGFRKPHMATDAEGDFYFLIYPAGGGACFDLEGETQCVEPSDKVELRMFSGETDNVMYASSDALRSARASMMLSLMYTTEFAYEGFSRDDEDAPAPWLSHGLAYAFADWWIKRQHGVPGVDPAPHRHSQPLTMSSASAGRQTAPFWVYSAGRSADGFAFAKDILEHISIATRIDGNPVDHADVAMRPFFPADDSPIATSGTAGLSNAFSQFIWRNNAGDRDYWIGRGSPSGAWDTVAPEAPMSVTLGRGPVERTISGHEALSGVRVPVRVTGMDGRAIGLTVRRWGHTENLVSFITGTQGGFALLRMDPDVWGAEYEYEVPLGPLGCEEGTSCEFDVYFVNANKDKASATGTHAPYTLEVEAARICAFPQGAIGVTYAAEMGMGRNKESVMKMTMQLPARGGQRGVRTSVEGTIAMGAGGIGIKRDFKANLMCDDAAFWIEDLDVEGIPDMMGTGGARAFGARLQLPQNAEVGMELGSVIQGGEFTQGGADSGVFVTALTNLKITGRERKRIGNVGEVQVWKIEGYTSGRFQMRSDALERIMEQDAEVREGLNEGSNRNDLRDAIAEFSGEETNTPITIYYSPVYGAVETVTGWDGPEQVTHRLVEMVKKR